MTKTELLEAIIQKQDELINKLNEGFGTEMVQPWEYEEVINSKKELVSLRQQIEKSKETKLSIPLDVPKTREINSTCYNRYKEAYNPDGFSTDAFKEGAKWAIKQIIERNQK